MHRLSSQMVVFILVALLFTLTGCPSSQPESEEIMIIPAAAEMVSNEIVTNTVATTLVTDAVTLPSPTPNEQQSSITTTDMDLLPTPTAEATTETILDLAAEPVADANLPAQLPLADSITTNWARIDPSGQQIVFWHRYTKYREKILNEIIDSFNNANPYGIQVAAVAQGDFGDLFSKTIAAVNTAESPHLVIGYQDDLATYYQSNGLIDLNPLLSDAAWGFDQAMRADFVPGVLESDRFAGLDGVQLGIATDRAQEVLYYNNTWLKAVGLSHSPSTPDEFQQAACAAVQHPFVPAQGQAIGYEIVPTASIFTSWVFAFGGEVIDRQSGQLHYNSEAAQNAMHFLQELVQAGCAQLVSERYGDQTNFGNGRLLFSTSSSSSLYFYGQAVEKGAGFQWSIAAFPYTTESPVMNLHGASLGILKTTPEQELAAWLFIRHYLSPTIQAKWAKATGGYPVIDTAQAGLGGYLAENPDYKQGLTLLPYSRPEPATPGYGLIRGAIGDAFRDILNGADVEGTLETLDMQANQMADQ